MLGGPAAASASARAVKSIRGGGALRRVHDELLRCFDPPLVSPLASAADCRCRAATALPAYAITPLVAPCGLPPPPIARLVSSVVTVATRTYSARADAPSSVIWRGWELSAPIERPRSEEEGSRPLPPPEAAMCSSRSALAFRHAVGGERDDRPRGWKGRGWEGRGWEGRGWEGRGWEAHACRISEGVSTTDRAGGRRQGWWAEAVIGSGKG